MEAGIPEGPAVGIALRVLAAGKGAPELRARLLALAADPAAFRDDPVLGELARAGMSRTQAQRTFAWGDVRRQIEAAGVTVLSAGLDEVPGVYEDIETVMAAQADLVEVVARFDPRIVKMAPAGERPED